MIDNYSAGGYIEAWCTKCKLLLGHTIVAMVGSSPRRVKCNTCGGEHNYRAASLEKAAKTSNSVPRKTKPQGKYYSEYMARLNTADMTGVRKYSIKSGFKKDDVIDHLQFGIGIVLSVIQIDKIDVMFRDGRKLLVQNRE